MTGLLGIIIAVQIGRVNGAKVPRRIRLMAAGKVIRPGKLSGGQLNESGLGPIFCWCLAETGDRLGPWRDRVPDEVIGDDRFHDIDA